MIRFEVGPLASVDAPEFAHLIGKRVRYSGDVCNAPREGAITAVTTNRWGTEATITWDEAETIGWERDGTPIEFTAATSQEHVRNILDTTRKGARFSLIAEEVVL